MCSQLSIQNQLSFILDSFSAIGAVGGVGSLDDSIIYVDTYMADITIGAKNGRRLFHFKSIDISFNCLTVILSNGQHHIDFSFLFPAIKTEIKSEYDDSVEYVSSYVQGSANDLVKKGTVKKEPSPSNSYMADDSSADSSAEIGYVDFSKRLYELYNSRRNLIATGSGVAPVLQDEEQQIGHDAENDAENGTTIGQIPNVKIEK